MGSVVSAVCPVSEATIIDLDFSGALPTYLDPGTAVLTPTQGFADLGPEGNKFGDTFLRGPTGTVITLTLSDLPPHTTLSLSMLFARHRFAGWPRYLSGRRLFQEYRGLDLSPVGSKVRGVSESSPRALRNARLAAAAAVVALLLAAQQLGVLQRFGDREDLARTLVGLGVWGYAAFLAAYTLLQPFGVPGTVFILVAPLIWPWQEAFGLSLVGTMSASVVGFSFARFVARDWLTRFIPQRFKQYEEALARRGFATVLVLRFVFWMPPLLHAFFGVSRVPFWTHFWASFLGYLVPLFLVSFFGQKIFDALAGLPPTAWVGLPFTVAIGALTVWSLRRARAARELKS
jgi:uncharacterized membrane protein YdjX (TVP38/TMEM64 family)